MKKINEFQIKTWENVIKKEIPGSIELRLQKDNLEDTILYGNLSFEVDKDVLYIGVVINSKNDSWLNDLKIKAIKMIENHKSARESNTGKYWVMEEILGTQYHFETEPDSIMNRQIIKMIIDEAMSESGSYDNAFKKIATKGSILAQYDTKLKSLMI